MTTASRAPRTWKGAIITIDIETSERRVVVFQYNPESLRRSLQPRMTGGQGAPSRQPRFTGAPQETISLEATVDASDQLEASEASARTNGILPQLDALEMLIYPKSSDVMRNRRLVDQGMIEIGPYTAPLTLFVWGKKRVVPVELESLSVREEMFDPHLNPLRAKVSLSARTLSYSDLDPSHRGHHLFVAHQQIKESLARKGVVGDPEAAMGFDPGVQ